MGGGYGLKSHLVVDGKGSGPFVDAEGEDPLVQRFKGGLMFGV